MRSETPGKISFIQNSASRDTISPPFPANRRSSPALNSCSESFQGAEINGMRQAIASNGLIVGIPGKRHIRPARNMDRMWYLANTSGTL